MTQEDIDATQAPLIEHLIELRQRLIYCLIGFVAAFALSFMFAGKIYNLLVMPFFWALGKDYNLELIYTSLPEKFFTEVKIGMFGGLFLAFPLIAIQIYRFVAPGLYRNERNAFRPYLIATPVFFVLGAAAVYFLLMPVAIRFFVGFQQLGGQEQAEIKLLPKVSEYLDFVMMLILHFAFCRPYYSRWDLSVHQECWPAAVSEGTAYAQITANIITSITAINFVVITAIEGEFIYT